MDLKPLFDGTEKKSNGGRENLFIKELLVRADWCSTRGILPQLHQHYPFTDDLLDCQPFQIARG